MSSDDFAAMTAELLQALRSLDAGRHTSMDSFMSSSGHELLTTWLATVCIELREKQPAFRSGAVIRRIQRDFDDGTLNDSMGNVFEPFDTSLTGIGLAAATADVATQGMMSAWGLRGLAAGVAPLVRPALRKLGYLPVDYKGSEWPFLYSFGSKATRSRHTSLGAALDNLSSDA